MAWRGKAWRGKVGQAGHGLARLGAAGRGKVWQARRGSVGHGVAWQGGDWQGLAGKANTLEGGQSMVKKQYGWKMPGLYSVSAQDAGEELARIYESRGNRLVPADVVDESRPQTAVLHPCFEWRDDVAAEKYRENQASGIIRAVVIMDESEEEKAPQVRAWYSVKQEYKSITAIMNSPESMESLLETAYRELKAFQRKYNMLKELRPVFDIIDQLGGGGSCADCGGK